MKKILVSIGILGIIGVGITLSVITTRHPSDAPEDTSSPIQVQYSEAPDLATKVASGLLPPVEDRLPDNPMLLQPVDGIGTYGGTYRRGMQPSGDFNSFTRVLPEGLLKYDENWTKVVPNLAQSYQANADATEYTFVLRKGVKWSDGVDFTTDDIMFWWDDLVMNAELSKEAKPQNWLMSDGVPADFEKIDDYTIKIKFAKSYGLFPLYLASVFGPIATSYPKHYVEQFHAAYNPDVQTLVAAEGLNSWTELLKKKVGNPLTIESVERYQNTEMPVLNAWMIEDVYGSSDKISATRNPYYWKIDPAGNQLPYMDVLEYTVAPADKLAQLAAAGEIDMQSRHIGDEKYRALLEQNATDGEYSLFETISSLNNVCAISLNQNSTNPVLREIFQNKNFRIGLSYAIDREQIIDDVFNGRGIPSQPAPRPESIFYDAEFSTQYTEYDVVRANQHHDLAFPDKDSDGYRTGPDGNRISFSIIVSDFVASWTQLMPMVVENWKAVGIDVRISFIPRAQYDTLRKDNQFDATMWQGDGGMEVIMEPRWYFPYSDESTYAPLWQYWYNHDPRGEEPPAIVKQQMELYDQIKATGKQTEQENLMEQILAISREQFYAIGISLPASGFGVVKNNVKNVPELMPYAWLWPTPYPTNPPLYYKEL